MIRQEIKNLIEKAIKNLYGIKAEVKIEKPAEAVYGDFASNIAMTLKKNPQKIANAIKSDLPALATPKALQAGILERVEVKNGFINFFISKEYLQRQIKEILEKKDTYKEEELKKIGKGQKVNVEFISANPTGPLTLGNGRGGFCGDVLANVLTKAGYKAEREYYINDIGEQIKKLGHSVLEDSEAVYKGSYIKALKKNNQGR